MNVKGIGRSRMMCAVTAAAVALAMTCAPCFAAEKQVKNVKDETVYVVTDEQGIQKEIIVSDHIKNKNSEDSIEDKSNLKDIENVKGDEKFSRGEADEIVWDAEGKDIYYQGKTEDEAPVSMSIKYYLNDKEVEGSELEGKSGRVKIKIHYENQAKVNVDGESVTVPFAAVTGMLVDSDSFKNARVNSGKVIDDGQRLFIVGMALPGIEDSLGVSPEKTGISDTVEITGEADKFSAEDLMTVVINDFFEEIDDSFEDLSFDEQVEALDEGAGELLNGTDTLYRGIATLNSNTGELTKGTDALNRGTSDLSSGIDTALKGSGQLLEGTKSLSENLDSSLSEMKTGAESLQSGSKELYEGILAVKAGIDGNQSGSPGLLKGAQSVVSGIGEAKDYLDKSIEKSDAVLTYLKTLYDEGKLSDDEYGRLVSDMEESKACQEGVASQMGDGGSLKSGAQAVASGVDSVRGAFEGDGTGGNPGLTAGSKNLYEGAGSLKAGLEQAAADSGSLTSGAQSLAEGAEALLAGEKQLDGGARELATGMEELKEKSTVLADGINQLDIGAKILHQGMKQFCDEGIEKIVSLYNDVLKGKGEELESLLKAGKEYSNFSRISNDMDGTVKVIYRTEISQQ